jgi:hypothetical protein
MSSIRCLPGDYFDDDEFGGGGDAFDADSGYQDYRRQQDYGGY